MSVAAVVKKASKPFWMARYAMATARCVFPRPGLPAKISGAPVGDEVGRQRRAEDVEAHRRLVREIEIIDGLEKRKVRASREAREPRLLAMRDLLGHEQREEVAIGPGLALGALDEVAPDATRIGEVQPFEERVEVVIGRDHDRPPTRREDAAVLGRVQVLRCAPPLRAPSATWTRPARGSRRGRYRRRPVRASKGSAGVGASEIVRDVLGADRLLGEATVERRRAAAASPCVCKQRVQPLDILDPGAWAGDG